VLESGVSSSITKGRALSGFHVVRSDDLGCSAGVAQCAGSRSRTSTVVDRTVFLAAWRACLPAHARDLLAFLLRACLADPTTPTAAHRQPGHRVAALYAFFSICCAVAGCSSAPCTQQRAVIACTSWSSLRLCSCRAPHCLWTHWQALSGARSVFEPAHCFVGQLQQS